MDTAYKDPQFEAYLVIRPDSQYAKRINLGPWQSISVPFNSSNVVATVEENDEIDLYFKSTDANAQLFFNALECCPITSRIQSEDGLVYCTPAEEGVKIYRSDSTDYDALRVDTLQISVRCNSNVYISFLNVIPKQLSAQEWDTMRDDLEAEIRGLAQDIVRRNIGAGQQTEGVIPPSDLYAFLVINKNANSIMSALLDIKDRPKYKLQKDYHLTDESENKEVDTETVKHYLRKGAPNNRLLVPSRNIVYDIQENRLLKKIIKLIDKKLSRFVAIITATLRYHQQRSTKNQMYESRYINGLQEYLITAKKLKAITSIIKSAEWFHEVSDSCAEFIPHSFALDSRYGSLYRTYMEVNRRDFTVQLDPQYSYSWKKSSSLYEMWCYICVCRYFLQEYHLMNSQFDDIFTKNQLFPFLESGTKVSLENDDLILEIVYDICLPKKSRTVELYNNPLFITGKHCRPDICINLYSKKSTWYIGSLAIECKYRKLASFWEGRTWSSRDQIKAYHNDSKSPLYYGGKFEAFSPRPVSQVVVFSPDDIRSDSREQADDNVTIKIFKPTADRSYIKAACEYLDQAIHNQLKLADREFGQRH